MQLIPWKLSLVVSLLHAIVFVSIARLGLQSPDYGAQSVAPIQLLESKSIAQQKNKASLAMSEPVLTKSQGAIHLLSVGSNALTIDPQDNRSELMSAPITPPSADLFINQAMQHFDRLILVKDGNLVGDHPSKMGAISDLADLYQIQLDVIERDGSPPLIFPRASLGLNTL